MRQRVSSRNTFFFKRIVPFIWFGGLAFVFGQFFIRGQDPGPPIWFMILMAPLRLVIGYFAMKKTVFDLVDEVFDEGESLLVRNKSQEERIPLSDISDVSYMPLGARVTLTLRKPSILGTEISFLPTTSNIPFVRTAAIRNLIKKINAQRAGERAKAI